VAAVRLRFNATKPQSHLILSRATDNQGNMQPAVSQWNLFWLP
jgi:hypothetical protein